MPARICQQLNNANALVYCAWSTVKYQLMKVTTRRARQQERFDVMEFHNEFKKAFGFVDKKAEYTLERGTTQSLDSSLGIKWDLVAGDRMLVTSIIFRRCRFCPTSPTEKLRCLISLIAFTPHEETPENYREDGREQIAQKNRLITDEGDEDDEEIEEDEQE